MAHKALDSGNFFDYLHPSSGGITLYGIQANEDAPSSERASAGCKGCESLPARDIGCGSSGSALLSRLASKKTIARSPELSRLESDLPVSSPLKGVVKESGSQALVAELCKDSPPSSLLSRVLGKRQRDSPSNCEDDDCVIVSGPEASSSSSSNGIGMQVVHDFVVPLEPVEVMEKMKAKRRRAKGSKRARHGRVDAQARVEDEVVRNPQGWLSLPVADILFQIGETSDNVGFMPAVANCKSVWYKRVRQTGQANCLHALAAVREVLKCAGAQALFPYIVDASWPDNCDEWKPLHTGMALWEEDSIIGKDGFCDCMFRSETHADLSGFGGSSGSGEAMHVQLRLNCALIARQLARQQAQSDMILLQGARVTGRCVEWRVVPIRKTKRRKRVESNFHLLDNRDDAFANQPPRFRKWLLRREQLRSLKWMEQGEDQPASFDLILKHLRIDPESATVAAADQDHASVECLFGWHYEMRSREFYQIRGGILGDAVGYGKTATMIGLIDSRRSSEHPIVPEDKEPYFFNSGATLVLVPSNLLDQWVSEFQKFLDCHIGTRMINEGILAPLRVVPVRTAAQLKALNVMQICKEADVVICSYRLLFSPVYRRRLLELAGDFADIAKSDSAAVRAAANVGSLRRNTRRFRESPREVGWKHRVETFCAGASDGSSENIVEDPAKLRFPVLEQFWWRRIVFDEFHELEAMGNTAQFASLKNLCGHYRWGLTGTPPTRDLTQISVLAQLFQIDDLLQCRESAGDEVARQMAQGFLDRFARQNTGQEELPVQLQEHIVEVHQTPEERAIYLQALHDSSGDVDDSSNELDASKSERLLKLCSHFAYGVGAAASSNADTECGRLLTMKEKSLSQALAAMQKIARKCELLWRFLPVVDDASQQQGESALLQSDREALLQRLRERYNVEAIETVPDAVVADAAEPVAFAMVDGHADMQHSGEDTCCAAKQNSEAASSPLSAYDLAVSVLRESRGLLLSGLQSKQERSRETGPLEDAVSRIPGVIPLDLADPAREDAKFRFLAAVDAYDSAYRSRCFLENALAATRGEASADQRSCSICLDDDIPREELSITSCAHIFHTACIAEVVAKMGCCPLCRKRLDAARDLTALAAEVQPERDKTSQSLDEADPEVASRFGSKLAAIAARLQAIKVQGEKAIVFCQWEDLKRKIADALSTIGLDHFELSGNVYQRSEVIRRFQEESGPGVAHVLLLSLEHSASGTNLTAANHVVFVHPMNAISSEKAVSYEAQAIGRCRRWGQAKSEVHCWRFVTRGTVEEAITADHRRDLWKTYLSKSQIQAAGGC